MMSRYISMVTRNDGSEIKDVYTLHDADTPKPKDFCAFNPSWNASTAWISCREAMVVFPRRMPLSEHKIWRRPSSIAFDD